MNGTHRRAVALRARLSIIDGKVACPRSGRWKAVKVCRSCPYLEHDGTSEASTITCRPTVYRFRAALERLIAA